MRSYIIGVLTLALLAAGACSRIKGGDDRGGSITFVHSMHAEQAECGDCHGEVASDGGRPAGKHIPKEHDGCASCHEVKEDCAKCHRGAREGVALARGDRLLNFSHKSHGERAKCATCHAAGKQGGASIPGHDTCASKECHARDYKALRCDKCHRDLSRYPLGPVASLSHGPGFAKNHGVLARQSVQACSRCHDQTFCADCHSATSLSRASVRFPEQTERGFIHRGDWLGRHFIEARSDPQSCRKCHGQRSCRACHALNGLAAAPEGAPGGGRTAKSAHPAGWMVQGSGEFHGRQARLDIGRCASCHDQGASSNCVSCHRVGGMGGNPHPAGWSWRDKGAQCRTTPMCRTCHVNGQSCE